jgi:endonuclease/exonuclease/phosphatase family metal-dependent hydrolase
VSLGKKACRGNEISGDVAVHLLNKIELLTIRLKVRQARRGGPAEIDVHRVMADASSRPSSRGADRGLSLPTPLPWRSVLCGRLLAVGLTVALLAGCGGGGRAAASFVPEKKPPPPTQRGTLRLLQLNVLQGATHGRAAAVAALIRSLNPDVVTLDEVNVHSIFNRIATRTGMYGYWVRANDAYSVGILSRVPLHSCTPYRQAPIRHAAYGCRVDLGGRSWWIFGTHLYCCDEKVRSQEVELLISKLNRHRKLPVVLAGDLNSHTPGDPDPAPSMLVIPELLRAGYIDSFRELHPAAQDPGLTISAPPYGHWEARIDYVFHSKLARATSAEVVRSVPGYRWPSDHAALWVTLTALPRSS